METAVDHSGNPSRVVEQLRRRVSELEAKLASATPEAHLWSVFDDMFEGIQILDFDFRYIYVNQTAATHGRRRREELIGQKMVDAYPGIERTEMFGLLQRCMTDRVPQQLVNHFEYPDGRSAWFDLRMNPVPMGVLVLSVDISSRKKAEEDLRQSREDLATTLECMAEGVITTDVGGRVTRMNPAAERLTGWSEDEGRERALIELVHFLNQKTLEPVDHPVDAVLRSGLKAGLSNDTVLVARHGSHIPVAGSGAPIQDAGGSIRGIVVVLKDMKEEYHLTAMLQQAQKMDAIGRLAGGIAHDFNNLLTVISGYTDMAIGRVAEGDPLREDLEEIGRAGEHAAALTRQLLAFSRKQVLLPTVLDLNAVVARMDKMLRRLIGEDIDLVTKLEPDLGPVEFDPGRIEQIIMNLAVNARDAMPRGGKLTIETSNVDLDEEYARTHADTRPGLHVMLAVTDTGTGMDAETRARIFEPFFTTKGPGNGTGLGLATVYGIVKQSGGNIWVYSEPGCGTAFKVYLPQTTQAAGPAEPPAPEPVARGGAGTVLVVEDEASVRSLIRRILEQAGYTVLSAASVDDALTLCERHEGEIHLLLTDVVLPEMGGRQLGERVLAVRPRLKVIYMSGYTGNAVVHHGMLDPGTAFVEKPIMPRALLEKIRECLS